jgi:hypothetical protein
MGLAAAEMCNIRPTHPPKNHRWNLQAVQLICAIRGKPSLAECTPKPLDRTSLLTCALFGKPSQRHTQSQSLDELGGIRTNRSHRKTRLQPGKIERRVSGENRGPYFMSTGLACVLSWPPVGIGFRIPTRTLVTFRHSVRVENTTQEPSQPTNHCKPRTIATHEPLQTTNYRKPRTIANYEPSQTTNYCKPRTIAKHELLQTRTVANHELLQTRTIADHVNFLRMSGSNGTWRGPPGSK